MPDLTSSVPQPEFAFSLGGFFFGLALGSFANVFFYRYPRGQSLRSPGSSCPQCRARIAWRDNIPILSYLRLGGRCRSCRAPISLRYPLVEWACALLLAAVGWKTAESGGVVAAAFCGFYFLLFLASGTDWITFFRNDRLYGILPDPVLAVLGLAGLGFAPFNPVLDFRIGAGISSALMVGGALWAFRWTAGKAMGREALGLGDVKLLAAVALWAGWRGAVWSLFFGSLIGSVAGLALIASGRMERRSALPFGPFLAFGSLSVLFLYF